MDHHILSSIRIACRNEDKHELVNRAANRAAEKIGARSRKEGLSQTAEMREMRQIKSPPQELKPGSNETGVVRALQESFSKILRILHLRQYE